MKTLSNRVLATATVLALFANLTTAVADEKVIEPFNGKDLTGWEGKEGAWNVENGAIVGESTPEKPCTKICAN